MESQIAPKTEPKMSAHQAREARYAKAKEAKETLKEPKDDSSAAEVKAYLAHKKRLDKREKAQEQRKKMVKLMKKSMEYSRGDFPVPQYARPDRVHKRAKEAQAQLSRVQPNENESDPAPEHLQATPNIVAPILNTSSSSDHPRDSDLRVTSPKVGHYSIDHGVFFPPLDTAKTTLAPKKSTLKSPTELSPLFPTVSPRISSIEHITQLPALRSDGITAFTGRSPRSTASKEANGWAFLETNNFTQSTTDHRTAETQPIMTNTKTANVDQRRSQRAANNESELDGLDDDQMKSPQDSHEGVDAKDDFDGSFKDDKQKCTSTSASVANVESNRPSTLRSASNTTATPAPAVPSPAQAPIARDTSFSTRPSRAAARNASAAITASQQKGRGRGRGRGKSKASVSAPPHTASAPPPPSPPPPPPPRPCGAAAGHNKTWGFVAGPGGPWTEPPVLHEPKMTGPSLRKNLRKETREAMVQLEKEKPPYDPHAPDVIRKQEEIYKQRVGGTMTQFPTSNVRGAQDWEENQKRRMDVAIREAMRIVEEEEREEEMEKQRQAKMKETAGKEGDNGQGPSRSQGQTVAAEYASDGESSDTAKADFDTDYVDEKSDEDDATLVVEDAHSDDGDTAAAGSNRGFDFGTIPRSFTFNEDFTQRAVAERKIKVPTSRIAKTAPVSDSGCHSNVSTTVTGQTPTFFAKGSDAATDTDQEYNDTRHNLNVSFSVPAPGPYVFESGDAGQSQEHNDSLMMGLMEGQLGLQLENPPPAGEAFPALIGDWPQFPGGARGSATGGGFGSLGEGPSGSGQGSR